MSSPRRPAAARPTAAAGRSAAARRSAAALAPLALVGAISLVGCAPLPSADSSEIAEPKFRGAASSGAGGSGVPVGASFRGPGDGSADSARTARTPRPSRAASLLAELATTRGLDERSLGEAERARKHRIQTQLIALHFLGERPVPSDGDPLVESLTAPYRPDRSLTLLREAYLTSIGRGDGDGSEGAAVEGVPAGTEGFRISAPIACTRVDGPGLYERRPGDAFSVGEAFLVYADVFDLGNRRVGDRYEQRVEVELRLLDRAGRERDRFSVTTEPVPTAAPVIDSHLRIPYTLPRGIPHGDARLVLSVRDVHSGARARRELPIRIVP